MFKCVTFSNFKGFSILLLILNFELNFRTWDVMCPCFLFWPSREFMCGETHFLLLLYCYFLLFRIIILLIDVCIMQCFFDTPGLMLKGSGYLYKDMKVRVESAWSSVNLYDVLMVIFDVHRHLTRLVIRCSWFFDLCLLLY